MWGGAKTTSYDPSLTRVVYPSGIISDYRGKGGLGYTLYDLVNKVKLVEFVTGDFSITPIWAPDGSKFIINSGGYLHLGPPIDHVNGEFYVVTRDGKQVIQVSNLNGGMADGTKEPHYYSNVYSWSPDGRYLAFWLQTYINDTLNATLAILDTFSGEVTDNCVSSGYHVAGGKWVLSSGFMPVWSADGKSIVTAANTKESGDYQALVIDLEGGYAVKIGEDMFPISWIPGTNK
jgi:Tol biopolymer transport system component